jgi:hypothetical protein
MLMVRFFCTVIYCIYHFRELYNLYLTFSEMLMNYIEQKPFVLKSFECERADMFVKIRQIPKLNKIL